MLSVMARFLNPQSYSSSKRRSSTSDVVRVAIGRSRLAETKSSVLSLFAGRKSRSSSTAYTSSPH